MNHITGLVCTQCGREYNPDEITYTCPAHDGLATGILDVRYDYEAVAEDLDLSSGHLNSLWRYKPLLPIDGEVTVRLGAGGTPLLDTPTLSTELGVTMMVKDETSNPTGSNKDRGSSVVVTRAVEQGHDVITCASTGNTAASLAGYTARAGLACPLFVPAEIPEEKMAQLGSYDATVFAVDGDYADAFNLCTTVAARCGWYNRSAAINPYAVEGNRTLGYELAEATHEEPVDWVVMPMGNGCLLAGVWKGLREFKRLGNIDNVPRMLGVQAKGASDIHDAFTNEGGIGENDNTTGTINRTIADSIDVRTPHNAGKACSALKESNGAAVVVTDKDILVAQQLLGRTEGIFVEPASAATVAGVRTAREDGIIDSDERVVVVATGSGLKDTESAKRVIDEPMSLENDPKSVPPKNEW